MSKSQMITFGAAGWLKIYLYGVGKVFQERLCLDKVSFSGASAGALVGTGLLVGADFDRIAEYTYTCVDQCRSNIGGAFQLRSYIDKCLENEIPKAERHSQEELELLHKVNDRLHVSVTELPYFRNVLISAFESRKELLTTLHATCNIPMLGGLPIRGKSAWMIDGGATNYLPTTEATILTVSVFGHADISPSKHIPARWAFYPPRESEMRELFQLGYDDAQRWVFRALMPKLRKHKLSATSAPCIMEHVRRSVPYRRRNVKERFDQKDVIPIVPRGGSQKLHVEEPQKLHGGSPKLHGEQPQKLHVEKPQKFHVEKPQKLHVEEPQKLHVEQPQKLHVEQPQKLHGEQPQKLHGEQPQKLHGESVQLLNGQFVQKPPKKRSKWILLQQAMMTTLDAFLLIISALYLAPLMYFSTALTGLVEWVISLTMALSSTIAHYSLFGQFEYLREKMTKSWHKMREVRTSKLSSKVIIGNVPILAYVIARRQAEQQLNQFWFYRWLKRSIFPI
eukprot:CAMPEP_0201546480 /NCGR_PEP_ID=MMETSP0173_2-20130828/2727_1 /ASSEMBLY_ACC=CAM_ASM_000268 /TAXON_ID=218659 /ORGANISM="Vexillifera sp., Strain DIVA3 564/2" /LENGTH=506 /DNA_ID=CAMNT_0047955133 /DNA_START=3 /DNA_END=1523 /DNA_ORIENTATION=-